MSISKAQWVDIESQLTGLFGRVDLSLQGRKLTLEKQFIAENQLAILVFIDGSIQPVAGWVGSKHYDPFVAQVWRKRSKTLYSAARIKQTEKELGKRKAKEFFPNLNKKLEYYEGYFTTFASLKRVLAKQKDLQMFVETTDAEAEPCPPVKA